MLISDCGMVVLHRVCGLWYEVHAGFFMSPWTERSDGEISAEASSILLHGVSKTKGKLDEHITGGRLVKAVSFIRPHV